MKRLVITLVLLGSIASFSACKKDKDDRDAVFTGKWSLVSQHKKRSENNVITLDTIEYQEKGTFFFIFNEDHSYTSSDINSSGVYELGDTTITMISINGKDSMPSAGTWAISGKQLSLHFSNQFSYDKVTYKNENTLLMTKL